MSSRRSFIRRTALGFGGYLALVATACKPGKSRAPAPPPPPPAPLPAEGLRALTAEQHRTIAAACERILPADEDPGAIALGCPAYIDRLMAEPESRALWGRALLGGLTSLDHQARGRFGKPFADAAPDEQEALLAAWQQSRFSGESAFFEVLHTLTLEGAFGDPSHGGNLGGKGFALVGFAPPPPLPPQPVPLRAK